LASQAAGQKTDVLTLRNGDEITGEASELTRGILVYKTDDAGTLRVEWDKVVSLESIHTFEVELASQAKLFGSFSAGPELGTAVVEGEVLPLIDIVSITEPGFPPMSPGTMR
jgi:hypothetical protein